MTMVMDGPDTKEASDGEIGNSDSREGAEWYA